MLKFAHVLIFSCLLLQCVQIHKFHPFQEGSSAILSSFKILIISDNTAEFVLISADVIFKVITILKELRITQQCSKNGPTLDNTICTGHDTLLVFPFVLHKNYHIKRR